MKGLVLLVWVRVLLTALNPVSGVLEVGQLIV